MPLSAEQLILFDKEFTFEEKDAIPTKSHLYVEASEFDKATPKNWKSPINFADGKVKIIIDVLEKPEGDTPTYWSVCYIGNKGQNGSRYSVAGSPKYTKTGSYEIVRDMKTLWQKDKVVWTEGLKKMSLVLKGPKLKNTSAGKSHAHLQPDLKKFFPTKVRFRVIQISEGSPIKK